jgi:putative peptidoglycan lipid II flippase
MASAQSQESLPDRSSTPHLARSAGLIGAATMTSRVLGLVRDQVMAVLFGAGDQMDAFNVAFRIPNLVRDLFAEGAMSAAFVPTFTRRLTQEGRESAWRLGSLVINALILTTGAIVLLGIAFAGPISQWYASAYASVPGKLELTVTLTRVMFPFLTMVAVAAALMGMLNSLHRFFVPALAPALFNVLAIVCTVGLAFLMPKIGLPMIMAPAIGVVAGGLGQVAAQWPLLRREGFRYQRVVDFRDEGLRQVLLLMGPAVIGLAAVQVNVLINTILATDEGTGAVSALNFAFRVMYMPIGLFGVSIATAVLPAISRHAARENLAEMRDTVSNGLRLMLMLNVPATFGLVALAAPIIALIFQHGRFTAADTAATAAALICYAPGLVGYSVVKIAVPSFYALRDSRTPVVVSIATMGVNILLNLTLVKVLGFKGLALGTAVAAIFNAVVLLVLLRTRLGGLDGRRIATALVKITLASLAMAGAAWGIGAAIGQWVGASTVWHRLLQVGVAILGGLAVLDLAARALRLDEFLEARHLVVSRMARMRGRPAR